MATFLFIILVIISVNNYFIFKSIQYQIADPFLTKINIQQAQLLKISETANNASEKLIDLNNKIDQQSLITDYNYLIAGGLVVAAAFAFFYFSGGSGGTAEVGKILTEAIQNQGSSTAELIQQTSIISLDKISLLINNLYADLVLSSAQVASNTDFMKIVEATNQPGGGCGTFPGL